MKIAIVVHGRFLAFDLARELLKRGHGATLFTNYPSWAVERFGISRLHVRSFWVHGGMSRLAGWLRGAAPRFYPERWLHTLFGEWAAENLQKEDWDVVLSWSGVSEEPFRALGRGKGLRLLYRGSSHIRTQARILEEEKKRAGVPLDCPSSWMIAREEREYALADRIIVPSGFAHKAFIQEGVSAEKLWLLPLGTSLQAFRSSPEQIESRCRRIRSGEPLRVLCVGAISFQKGLLDFATVTKKSGGEDFRFRWVGTMTSEAKLLLKRAPSFLEVVSHRPEADLPLEYAWADLFVFPTLQDGYAVVLAQAAAQGLPTLTTTNCAGPDFIRDGENGWIFPIRSPEAILDRLRWCHRHREELAGVVRKTYEGYRPRDWADVARGFESLCTAFK